MNKNESKYFNTAVKMDKALIALLEKKDFEYITIKEICEQAEVNRSTFYLHYENTADLLRETTRYITDRFLSYFSVENQSIAFEFENRALNDLIFVSPEYLSPYLTFIKENQRIFKTSIRQFGTMDFEGVYKKMFRYIFNPVLARFDFPEKDRVYILKFYLTGITAIVMEWLENDCSDEIDSIIRIIIDCVVGKSRE
ncbi:MAG: TetR/AcrR family transcriptional regulator [Clostridia bacterium]|nr:TetR/AcrR family transcriptional regulator [Clostridia bacterium]